MSDASLRLKFSATDELLSFFNRTRDAYYYLGRDSPGVFQHYLQPVHNDTVHDVRLLEERVRLYDTVSGKIIDYSIEQPVLSVQLYSSEALSAPRQYSIGETFNFDTAFTDICAATSQKTHQADRDDISSCLRRVFRAQISLRLRSACTRLTTVLWDVSFGFSIVEGGIVQVESVFDPTVVSLEPNDKLLGLGVLAVVLSMICAIMRTRVIWRWPTLKRIFAVRCIPHCCCVFFSDEQSQDRTAAVRILIADNLNTSQGWASFGLLVDAITFVSAILLLQFQLSSEWYFYSGVSLSVFLGTAVLCHCIYLLSYFRMYPKYFLLMHTVKVAAPRLVAYSLGLFPVYIGLTLLIYSTLASFSNEDFVDSADLQSFLVSVAQLFSAMQGDNLLVFFDNADQIPFIGNRFFIRFVYGVSIIFTMGMAANFMLTIIMVAYKESGHELGLEQETVYEQDYSKADEAVDEVLTSSDESSSSDDDSSGGCSSHSNESAMVLRRQRLSAADPTELALLALQLKKMKRNFARHNDFKRI